jgi:hypothetical protein
MRVEFAGGFDAEGEPKHNVSRFTQPPLSHRRRARRKANKVARAARRTNR